MWRFLLGYVVVPREGTIGAPAALDEARRRRLDGRESATRAQAGLDFGQKKAPSATITRIAERILSRS
jgi:hypothetical protein